MTSLANRLRPEEISEMVRRYASGERVGLIAPDFGITNSAVVYHARKAGLDVARTSRRIPLKQDAFSILTPEVAYWIGFIMADGSVKGPLLDISISIEDIEHLKAFRDFLGSEHVIGIRHKIRSVQCRFTIHSPQIIADLAKYGVVERKMYVGRVIRLEDDRDFWRGFIDGDGCLGVYHTSKGSKYARLQMASTRAISTQFVAYVQPLIGRWLNISGERAVHCQVQVSGVGAETIIKHLYEDACVALPRKAKIAAEITKRPEDFVLSV